ncbi:SrtB family sortase [Clostridia bacterium]|nr:SrtB family sortase [Clostridia bacterium]
MLAYNTYPKPGGIYKNGRRRNTFMRIVMAVFPVRGDDAGEIVRKIIFLIALTAFMYFGGTSLFTVTDVLVNNIKMDMNRELVGNMNFDDEMRDRVVSKNPEILPKYIMAYDVNNDLVGQVSIPDMTKAEDDDGRNIFDYLVYQGEDNIYYLDHAPDNSPSQGGSIFADYRNEFSGGNISDNTILYGHNILTGNYFAKLSRYYNVSNDPVAFYKTHPIVKFNTIYEESDWKIFACVLFNTMEKYGEVYPYNNILDFGNKNEFNKFVLDIMDRSVLFTDVDLKYGDELLTLSTCYYPFDKEVDTRVVVFARKVRPGESSQVNVNKAYYNTNELRFEKQAKLIGDGWKGRIWDTNYLLSYTE